MNPCIIWATQRSRSTLVRQILELWSDWPMADDEPFDPAVFDGSGPHWQFGWIACRPEAEWPMHLRQVCDEGWIIKHVYDLLPLNFNLALVRAADASGYRHIHLDRLDALARLVSLGVAISSCRWTRDQHGKYQGQPLNVAWLIARHNEAKRQWRAISEKLPLCFELRSERLNTTSDFERLSRFLHVDHARWRETLPRINEMVRTGGQDTAALRPRVPNVAELRRALA